MFNGIIKKTGVIRSINKSDNNYHYQKLKLYIPDYKFLTDKIYCVIQPTTTSSDHSDFLSDICSHFP